MAQRYVDPQALAWMAKSLCPECGGSLADHSDDFRFWVPRECSLRPDGVTDRIEQFKADEKALDKSANATKDYLAGRYYGSDVKVIDNPWPDWDGITAQTYSTLRDPSVSDEEYDNAGVPEWTI